MLSEGHVASDRHHPGKGMHQLRGELISFLYSLIFLDALHDVQSRLASASATVQAVREQVSSERAGMVKTTVVHKPVSCGKYNCETKPQCHTNYRSHFSEDQFLSQQIVGPLTWKTNVERPAEADTQFKEFRPGYYSSDSKDGGIHLKINIGEVKFVLVCSYHFPNAHLAMEYYLEMNVPTSRLTADYIPSDKVVNWEADVKEDRGWGCQKVHNLPEGQHVLGIRFKENDKKAAAGISHLITWD